MSRPSNAAGNCLPGADSGSFLIVLAAVAVLFAVLAAWSWRQRRPAGAHRFERTSRQELVSALTVAEIQRRLRREAARAARPPRAPRVVTVVPRLRALSGTEQHTAPLDPIGPSDDGD